MASEECFATESNKQEKSTCDHEIWSLVDPALIVSEIAENDEEKAKEIAKRIHRAPRVILESFQSLSLLSTTIPTLHSLALILMIPNLQKLSVWLKGPKECSEEETEIEKKKKKKKEIGSSQEQQHRKQRRRRTQ